MYRELTLVALCLTLTACKSDLTPAQHKLKAKLPPDAEITTAGTLQAHGKVIHIADGDTLTVIADNREPFKIRLQGIDAPELGQPFGKACKTQLAAKLNGQAVTVEAYKQDKYGRVIAKVHLNDEDIALAQLHAGCGWHYTAYQKEQSPTDQKMYSKAEANARKAKRGLWQEPNPVAPWNYRQQK